MSGGLQRVLASAFGSLGIGIATFLSAAEKPEAPARQATPSVPATAPASVKAPPAAVAPVAAPARPAPAWVIQPASATDAPAAAATKYKLAYKFQLNQVVRYEVMHETEITTKFNEATEISRNKSNSRRNYRVVKVSPEGDGDLELTIDWVHMTAVTGNKPPEVFKSDDTNFQPAKYDHILQSVGKPQAIMQFNAAGFPLKLISRATPEKAAAEEKPVIDAEGKEVSAKPADVSLESYLSPLPEQPVAVGDTWKERFELRVKGEDKIPILVSMFRGYRLMSIEQGRATIEFKTKILTPNLEASMSAQLIQRETVGKIVFDIEQGMIVARDTSVDREVIGPFGPKSSMRAVSNYRERLLTGASVTQVDGKSKN